MKMKLLYALLAGFAVATMGQQQTVVDGVDCVDVKHVEMKSFAFSNVGDWTEINGDDCVCWTNRDGSKHSVMSIGANTFTGSSSTLAQDEEYCTRFGASEAGKTFNYRCGPHAQMKGSIMVASAGVNPTFAPVVPPTWTLTDQEECEQKLYVLTCNDLGEVLTCGMNADDIQFQPAADKMSCEMSPKDACEHKPYVMTCTDDGKVTACDADTKVNNKLVSHLLVRKKGQPRTCELDKCNKNFFKYKELANAKAQKCCFEGRTMKGALRLSSVGNGDDRTCQAMVGQKCVVDDDPGNADLCCSADGYYHEGTQKSADYACDDDADFTFDCTSFKASKCRRSKQMPFNCRWKSGACTQTSMCVARKQAFTDGVKLSKYKQGVKSALGERKRINGLRVKAQKKWKDNGMAASGVDRADFMTKKAEQATAQAVVDEAKKAFNMVKDWRDTCISKP